MGVQLHTLPKYPTSAWVMWKLHHTARHCTESRQVPPSLSLPLFLSVPVCNRDSAMRIILKLPAPNSWLQCNQHKRQSSKSTRRFFSGVFCCCFFLIRTRFNLYKTKVFLNSTQSVTLTVNSSYLGFLFCFFGQHLIMCSLCLCQKFLVLLFLVYCA